MTRDSFFERTRPPRLFTITPAGGDFHVDKFSSDLYIENQYISEKRRGWLCAGKPKEESMRMKLMLMGLLLVAGIALAGCSKLEMKTPGHGGPGGPPAAGQPGMPPGGPGGPAPTAAAPARHSLEGLCTKFVEATKDITGAAWSAALEKQTLDNCMASAKQYKSSPKSDAAIEAFVSVIDENCEGKKGQEWLACYGKEAQNAAAAAAKAGQ
jgi:hypothetical protein